jgi:hypothetical protein
MYIVPIVLVVLVVSPLLLERLERSVFPPSRKDGV